MADLFGSVAWWRDGCPIVRGLTHEPHPSVAGLTFCGRVIDGDTDYAYTARPSCLRCEMARTRATEEHRSGGDPAEARQVAGALLAAAGALESRPARITFSGPGSITITQGDPSNER